MAIHIKHGPNVSTAQVRFCCQWDQKGGWRFQSRSLESVVTIRGAPTTKTNSGQLSEPPPPGGYAMALAGVSFLTLLPPCTRFRCVWVAARDMATSVLGALHPPALEPILYLCGMDTWLNIRQSLPPG